MAELNYTPQQRAAIEHEGSALLISAAAGSGKTRVLVERLMRAVLEQGEDIDRFLVITFTRAAAAELRGRVLDELARRLAQEPGNRHIRRQMTLVYKAQIGTIHGFCASVLREYAHLCGLRPDFRMLDESEGRVLRVEVLEELLEKRYSEMDESFAALVDALSAGRDDRKLMQRVLQTYETVQSRPYPARWMEAQMALPLDAQDAGETVWGAYLLERTRDTLDYWQRTLRHALETLRFDPKLYGSCQKSFQETIDSLGAFVRATQEGWDACFGREVSFPRLTPARGFAGEERLERAKSLRNACKKAMEKLTARFDGDSAAMLEDCRVTREVTNALLRLVMDFERAFSREKRRRGAVDFSDLEHLALNLLVDAQSGAPTETARELARRYSGVLVDEYQDVNRVQDLIFTAVSQKERNLTMVGDVKQSIYRFRLADPTIFLDKYDRFADEPGPGEARRILLSQNFRSRPEILDEVNTVFSAILSRELGELDYTEREYLRYGGAPVPEKDAAAVSLRALLAPDEADSEARMRLEAGYIAGEIARMVDEKEEIGGRPCQYGDFAILLRSTREREEIYAAALRVRGIPAATGKAVSILDKPEITTLLSFLQILDNPRQDVPLIAVLRSPLYGFTADELARLRLCDREGDYFSALCAAEELEDEALREKTAAFLRQLDLFRQDAAELPSDRLLQKIFDETGLPALASRGDPEAQTRLYLLLDYAREFESRGYKGLFAFVTQLREQAEQDEFPLKLAPAASGQEVRITSIHASKGLEYPVVFLADLCRRFNMSDAQSPLLLHQTLGVGARRLDRGRRIEYPTLAHMAIAEKLREESLSEEMRVLYVAMTRAKERLVMLCTLKEGQLAAIPEGLSLPLERGELRASASAGEWLLRVHRAAGLPVETLTPPPPAPTRSGEEGAPEPQADAESVEQIAEALRYVYPHGHEAALPSKLTATELKGDYPSAEAAERAEQVVSAPAPLRRPRFAQREQGLSAAERGTALHLVMQYIDYDRTDSLEAIEAEIRRLEQMRLLLPEQATSVDVRRILRFFRSETGQRVLHAEALWREFKFSLMTPAARLLPGESSQEPVLLQGVVDCCFLENGALTVLDFKTDWVTETTVYERAALYRGQLLAYEEAMTRILGHPVREKLLYFFAAGACVTIE